MTLVKLIERARRDERGAGIVTALVITLTIFAMGATWTGIGIHQVESSSYERSREQALHAAEAGLNAAIGTLAGDLDWPGTSGAVALADGTGEYEVAVTPVDPTDPSDLDRYIVARGYAPEKTSTIRAARQIEQQVRLDPLDGFRHALFASPGGIVGGNNSEIRGDVYSAGDLTLANTANVFGSVTAAGNITTNNDSNITQKVWAGKAATIDNVRTTIHDDVWSGSNAGEGVALTGTVFGDVQTGGTLTGAGTVNGVVSENNPPPAPPSYTQPTFTWDPDNYPAGTAAAWTSASNFITYWQDHLDDFSGHHRIAGGDDASNKITLDQPWTMTTDVTLVTNGPITLARNITNGAGGADLVLTIVSLSARTPALSFTNNVILPSSIKILLFAPNGPIDFTQLKSFHGAVYGNSIDFSQRFSLDYVEVDVPGFSWGATSAALFDVRVRTFKEVAFQEP